MSQLEIVSNAMSALFTITAIGDGVRVITHCVYPSGSLVPVVVRGGVDTFYVSDEGRGVREIEAAGAEVPNADRLLKPLLEQHELTISKGVIRSPQCSASELPSAIVMVANASKSIADYLFSHVRIRPHRNFRAVVSSFLRNQYQTVQEDFFVGSSNKQYRFDNVIILSGKKVIVDPVVPDHNSIVSRVVANMDVRQANYPDVEQRIVYDDGANWKAEDLNILQSGAKVVPFSKAPEVIRKLAKAS